MTSTTLVELQRQVLSEFLMYQQGVNQEFPRDGVRDLLRTKSYDGWAVGLYLLANLERNQITTNYFEDESTYSALAT